LNKRFISFYKTLYMQIWFIRKKIHFIFPFYLLLWYLAIFDTNYITYKNVIILKFIFSKNKILWKKMKSLLNYSKKFKNLTCKFQNSLIILQICVEHAFVLHHVGFIFFKEKFMTIKYLLFLHPMNMLALQLSLDVYH